jgi:hypothetical protein
MADTRTLTVSLKAETASLKKGLADARNQLGLLQKSSQTTANVLKTAFASGAIIYGLQSIANGIRSVASEFGETATMIEDTKHLADAIGATTEEIQVLQRAAGLAEVDMDMLGRNVKMLTKNLGNASLGTGPAADMLDRLGISADQLIRMPLTEQLAAIGERMQTLGSSAQRVAVATALFGKSGTDMIPFLMQSSQGLRDLQAEMVATGEVFSATDAAMVDEMGDSVTMAWGVWNALKNEIVVGLAPAIKAVSDLVRQFGMQSSDVMREHVAGGIQYVVDRTGSLLDNLNKIKATYYLIGYTGNYIGAALAKSWQMVGQVFAVVMTSIQETFFRVISIIGKGIDLLTKNMVKLAQFSGMPGAGGLSQTNIAGAVQEYLKLAEEKSVQAVSEFGTDKNGSVQSYLDSMIENERRFMETFAKESNVGDKFREMINTPIDSEIKKFYDDSMDILPEIEKEKALREGIADTMKETADYAKDIKDFGEGTSYRTGEYSPRVGGVTGGVGGIGATNPIGMSAAGATASSRGNASTGADGSIPLLQGILDATRMTAMNTGRQQVPVLG